jgi:hypothetical protein
MVHAAMHDAVQAFQGRFEPYFAAIPDASGSPIVAAATAAHDVLVGLFPAQAGTLDTTYDDYLTLSQLRELEAGRPLKVESSRARTTGETVRAKTRKKR